MNTAVFIVIFGVMVVALLLCVIVIIKVMNKNSAADDKLEAYLKSYAEIAASNQRAMTEQQDAMLRAMSEQQDYRLKVLNEQQELRLRAMTEQQDTKLNALNEQQDTRLRLMSQQQDASIKALNQQQESRLKALEDSMSRLKTENNQQIEGMRKAVDSKLDAVYKGLGEMQSVAANVGDLKKILTNVKTRGILGEVQLSAILEQILTAEQYDVNVATAHGSTNRVEFAIKLPGDGESCVYLPIDSKFPGDSYSALMDAYDTGDKLIIDAMKKKLFATMTSEAKDIRDKYIDPPYTTDFAIMFLPFEGLYAEAVNGGMIEQLQRKYKVTIAGPTTMAALLNSLQMGFNTLAIEKKSSEVWELLGAVKTEFETFGDVLSSAQNRINQANTELDKLIGTRTRQIQRKLKNVVALEESETRRLLDN